MCQWLDQTLKRHPFARALMEMGGTGIDPEVIGHLGVVGEFDHPKLSSMVSMVLQEFQALKPSRVRHGAKPCTTSQLRRFNHTSHGWCNAESMKSRTAMIEGRNRRRCEETGDQATIPNGLSRAGHLQDLDLK